MTARFEMCKEKGFDAVEPDNMEGYANDTGFPLTAAEQLTYNEWVAEEVHSLGMAVLAEERRRTDARTAALLRRGARRAVQPVPRMRRLRAVPGGRQARPERRVQAAHRKFCAADNAAGIMGARYNLALNGKRYQPCW